MAAFPVSAARSASGPYHGRAAIYCGRDGESGAGGGMVVARERDPPARCPVRENAVSHTGGIYGRITPRRKRHDKRRT